MSEQYLNSVQQKLQLLLKDYQRLQKENEGFQKEIAVLKEADGSQKQLLERLEQQIITLKYAQDSLNENERLAFARQINQYIKELDTLIAFLSK